MAVSAVRLYSHSRFKRALVRDNKPCRSYHCRGSHVRKIEIALICSQVTKYLGTGRTLLFHAPVKQIQNIIILSNT